MKVIEQNTERTWISSEANQWVKLICVAFSLLFFSMYFWGGNNFSKYLSIIGGIVWLSLLTSIANTIFDVANNIVYSRYHFIGVKLRDIEAPINTTKLLSAMGQYNPNLYLMLASGKTYRIGDFFTENNHDIFINNLRQNVPIAHDKNF